MEAAASTLECVCFEGFGTSEIREMNQLRDEVTRLKRLHAGLSLDKAMLHGGGLVRIGSTTVPGPGMRSRTKR